MALKPGAQIFGDKEAKDRFNRLGSDIRTRARDALIRLGAETAAVAAAYAPVRRKPPQKRRYGPLNKTIKAKFTETETEMRVRIGPPIFYGAFQEQGVNEKIVVVTNKRTRPKNERGIIGLGQRKQKDGTLKAYVRRGIVKRGYATSAFKKRVRVPPHPFMGPALATMRDRVLARLGAVIVDASQED